MPKHGSINLYVHGNEKASTLTQLLNYVLWLEYMLLEVEAILAAGLSGVT